jgi:dipeptidyl-peptidase-4
MNRKFYAFPGICLAFLLLLFSAFSVKAQRGRLHWATDGYQYYSSQNGGLVELDTRDSAKKTVILTSQMLTPAGGQALGVDGFSVSDDGQRVLLYTNSKRVWRLNTRGDYWIYDLAAKTLKQIGKDRPVASLMFAKLSPDGTKAAYVSEHNLYVEDLSSGAVKQLTFDGAKKLINGTFDWAYEEEFDDRDGFRWSPDSRALAYWQIDASKIKNYLMLNTTDSIYPFVVPVEYPVAGEDPSSCKIGVVDVSTAKTTWMDVPGDNVQHYIPRMEWTENPNQIILQQLNRAQNESKIFICNVSNGTTALVHDEQTKSWIDAGDGRDPIGWNWINKGKDFIWLSEKDGWRHIYRISTEGKETLITKGDYDVIDLSTIDEAGGYIYFIASPDNATQRYLYRVKIKGGNAERVTPADQAGTSSYEISPNGKIALHTFSNIYTQRQSEVISLPDHKHISGKTIKLNTTAKNKPEFFKVTTVDGITMDGWMVKPTKFDSTRKYPVVFYVYSEPAGATVTDAYGTGRNGEYIGNMADDGYIYVSLDNRGTPAPKGAAWRKSIYKNVGLVNIEDQAMGAKEVLKWPFIDTSRVAVWGWSGGGSCTLNLMFQHPEIYKTGIAVAAVGWELSYDNIYQERYMGVPIDSASRAVFIKGSPVTYAKNLRGNLLYVHGTGDDNVHYRNAELLINELVKYNRQFQLMSFPNRTHGIFEGPGTTQFLRTLYTNYLKEHCPPGGR